MRLGDRLPALPNVYVARRNLHRNRLRTGLAVLSVFIGVLAIVSLGMFSTTLQTSVEETFEDIGNEIVVTPALEEGVTELETADVRRIRRAAGPADVLPVKVRRDRVARSNERAQLTVYGMESPGTVYDAAEGEIPPKLRTGALVGSDVADRFDLGRGSTITVGSESYRVRAVLRSQGDFSPIAPDELVVLPEAAFETESYAQVVVSLRADQSSHEVATAIESELNPREERVSVLQLARITRGIDELFVRIRQFLLGVGFVALLVASVSILNTMLMSTVQRRAEIGVIRAVGVGRPSVLKILLIEATLLGLIGSLLGVSVAVVLGGLMNWLVLGDALAVLGPGNLAYVAFGVALGTGVCVFSGLFPAWRAANERPAEAIRA